MPHGEIQAQCVFYSNLPRREEKPKEGVNLKKAQIAYKAKM